GLSGLRAKDVARGSIAPVSALPAGPDRGAGDRHGGTRSADERADHVAEHRSAGEAAPARDRRSHSPRRRGRTRAPEPHREPSVSRAVSAQDGCGSELTELIEKGRAFAGAEIRRSRA